MNNNIKAIAFYLPQYHPIPENDKWWGKGFTEWTNVTKAQSLFSGHYQPHLPADLGFYDLRLPELRQAQADLAREYGIYGFCYYHYWFNGKRLLERPFNEVLASGKPNFPFCLCWANENWTRRWDGLEQEILMSQTYSPEDDLKHIHYLISAFKDSRYIKINGKPLLLIYRINSLPDAGLTSHLWHKEVIKAGFPGLYLCTVISLPILNFDPTPLGFDGAVEFVPGYTKLPSRIKPTLRHRFLYRLFPKLKGNNYYYRNYYGNYVTSYDNFAQQMINYSEPKFRQFPCVTPGWDNSARRKNNAVILTDSTPEKYGQWLQACIKKSCNRFEGEERLVFINAWNEWAEGNHLEPDLQWGHRYLEETLKAISSKY